MAEPTATTRDEQQQRTRRELLEAAAGVFAERGYHAASVDQIAAAAGYTKGAVYSNFASKEALFLALLDQHVEEATTRFEDLFETSDPADRPRAVGRGYADAEVLSRPWVLLQLEFLLYAARNPAVQPRVQHRSRETYDWITSLAERHLSDLGADGDGQTAADLATALEALANGLMLTRLADPERVDPPRVFTRAVEWLSGAAARD